MDQQPVSRHEFLQSLGRKGMLLGLSGVGIAAIHGTKDISECFNHNYCDSCWGYTACALPEKKETKDERDHEIRPA